MPLAPCGQAEKENGSHLVFVLKRCPGFFNIAWIGQNPVRTEAFPPKKASPPVLTWLLRPETRIKSSLRVKVRFTDEFLKEHTPDTRFLEAATSALTLTTISRDSGLRILMHSRERNFLVIEASAADIEILLKRPELKAIDLDPISIDPPIGAYAERSIREQLLQQDLLGEPTSTKWRILRLSLPATRAVSHLDYQDVVQAYARSVEGLLKFSAVDRDLLLQNPQTWFEPHEVAILTDPEWSSKTGVTRRSLCDQELKNAMNSGIIEKVEDVEITFKQETTFVAKGSVQFLIYLASRTWALDARLQ